MWRTNGFMLHRENRSPLLQFRFDDSFGGALGGKTFDFGFSTRSCDIGVDDFISA
jgi:hypothetical protein